MTEIKAKLFDKIMRMTAPRLDNDDRAKLVACYFPGVAAEGLNLEAVSATVCTASRTEHTALAVSCTEWLCADKTPDDLSLMLEDSFDGNSTLYLAYSEFMAGAAPDGGGNRS